MTADVRHAGSDIRIAELSLTTAVLGESPVWMQDEQAVLWVDMPAGNIHRTTLAGETVTLHVNTYLGAVVPDADGGLIAATEHGFDRVGDSGALTPLHHFLPAAHRMNDAKVDPAGRFWAGSVHREFVPSEGTLHVLEAGHDAAEAAHRVALDGLTQPNGLGWSPDGATFYLVDTAARTLTGFDFAVDTGTLSRRRVLRRFPAEIGYADGLTVDAAGCLWIAMWDGGTIRRIAPDGTELAVVDVDIARPSSCTFAGPGLDRLVVTSARHDELAAEGDAGGRLFVIDGTGAVGLPPTPFGRIRSAA